ncbi:MAG: hypothetical protein Q8O66_03200 [bacterium]|nr:hypothetical protein [bacterium]
MMEYRKAIDVLMKMLSKYSFSAEEKEAIMTAVGTLDFGSLAKNRMKRIIKAKQDKRKKDLKID